MKTLAELKRHLQVGVELTCVFASNSQRFVGKQRKIIKTQGNGIYLEIGDGDNRGSFLEFPKASLIEVNRNGFKIFWSGKRELTEKEKSVLANRPRDPKQEEIDMLTDTNVMFWRNKQYLKEQGFDYLFVGAKGKRLDRNDMKVIDPAIKGDLALKYKFVKGTIDEN